MSIKSIAIAFSIASAKAVFFSYFIFAYNLVAQNWPMVNSNKERTSWAEYETRLSPPLKKALQFSLNGRVSSGISSYGNMLFVSVEGTPNRVVVFDTEKGTELWGFEIPESRAGVSLVPAVNDSLVLCGGQNGLGLYALDRLNGAEKWFKSIGTLYARNPIIDDDIIYIVTDSLYCLHISNGATIWSFPVSVMNVTPAIDDQKVYICGDRKFIAFNKLNGEVAWQIDNSQRYYSTVTLDEDYIYTYNSDSIVALNKGMGSVHWGYEITGRKFPDFSTNAIAITDSFLCFSIWENLEHKGELYTLDKGTGNYRWHYTFDSTGVYSPTIANGNVYAINYYNKSLWGFDLETGQPVFFDDSERYLGQPIIANNTLFVGAFGSVCSFNNTNTRINSTSSDVAKSFELFPNYPNPFNHSTRFRFRLAQSSQLNISVYNLLGSRIKTISDKSFVAGSHTLSWDGRNDNNEIVPSGIYILNLNNKHIVKSIKMILLK